MPVATRPPSAAARSGLRILLAMLPLALVPRPVMAEGPAQLTGGAPITGPASGPAALAQRLAQHRGTALERALQATVRLSDADTRETFLGSGFVYGDAGLVVTNAHVAGDHQWLAAHFGSGPEEWVMHLRLRAIDRARDLALFDITEPFDLPPLRAATNRPLPGDVVYALGAPLGLGQSLSQGTLSHPGRQVDPAVPQSYYQHDAATNPGSSGGPLINAAGEVVAVNARIADGSRLFVGVAYAIPISQVDRMIAADLPPVPDLGLTLRPLSLRMRQVLDLKLPGGVLVEDLSEGGAAARAGLRPGDILLSLGDHAIDRPGALAFALEARSQPEMTLGYFRPGTLSEGAFPQPSQVTLDLRPEDFPSPSARAQAPRLPLGLELDATRRRVIAVAGDSAAFTAGIAEGDWIEAVNGDPEIPLSTAMPDRAVLLRLLRDGRRLHVMLDPAAAPSLKRPVTGNALDPAVIPF